MDIKAEVLAAEKRIRPYIRHTYLDLSNALSRMTGCHVYLKLENQQRTGSFKARGALSKLLSLSDDEKKRGIITASTGNHGAGTAYGLSTLGIKGTIFVPENADSSKRSNIENYGVAIETYGDHCAETEMHAREYAKQHNMTYISPYNDEKVIAGQGTIAFELMEDLNEIDAVFVAIGGGGMISGIAGYLKSCESPAKIVGCLPVNSPVMAESVKAGKILEMDILPTLSDATAGGIEPGAITFGLCQRFVDDYQLVSEDEIKSAITLMLKSEHLLLEGAAAVAVAAFLKQTDTLKNKNVVLIICGGNISIDALKSVLCSHCER